MYAPGAPEMYTIIIFGLETVLQVLKPLSPPLSKSRLEGDSLKSNLKAAALFFRVLYIAIIVVFKF